VSGAPILPGKRPHPSAFSALMSSTQILQRSIIREKLKVQQPDIYIDVEVDEFYVLDFHRFKKVLAAAAPAKEHLKRQLARVLASHTTEALPAVVASEPPPHSPPRKRRLPSLKRLTRAGKA
jgi:NTE family protein